MRALNERELQILKKKEKRLGRKLNVEYVQYRKAFPRSTICIVSNKLFPVVGDDVVMGVTMRGRKDEENQLVAESQSFVRALNSL